MQRHVDPKDAAKYPTGLGAGMEWRVDPVVVAVYSFEAQESKELSFQEGEHLTILKKGTGGWWEAENAQKIRGWIPESYVKEVGTTSQSGAGASNSVPDVEAKVLFDFEAGDDDELTLKMGDPVKVLSREGDWWLVTDVRQRQGLVPSNYLQVIGSQPAHSSSSSRSQPLPPPTNGPNATLLATPHYECEAVAMYDYEGLDENELSFKEGERLKIIKRDPAGWWEAVSDQRKRGWIPGNYVEVVIPK